MNTDGLYGIIFNYILHILYYIILYYIIITYKTENSGHVHHFPTAYTTYTSGRFGGGLNGDSSRCTVACYEALPKNSGNLNSAPEPVVACPFAARCG